MSKGKTDKDPQNEAHKHKTETTATTNENEIVVIDLLPKNLKNGLLNGAPLREGDVLKTVNNRGASDFLVNGNLTGYLPSANFEDGECVTFVSERGHGADADAAPSGEHSKGNSSNSICDDDQFSLAIVRAFCRKPASMDQMTEEKRCLMIGLEFHRVYAEDDGEYDNHNDNDTNDPEEGESESSDNDDNDDDDDDDNTEESDGEESVQSFSALSFSSISALRDASSVTVAEESPISPLPMSPLSHTSPTATPKSRRATEQKPPPKAAKAKSSSSFLQIDKIDPHGLFAHSVLNQGDIVLAINGVPICATEDTSVEEAYELLVRLDDTNSDCDNDTDGATTTPGSVDIVALNPRMLLEVRRRQQEQERQQKARKGASLFSFKSRKAAKKLEEEQAPNNNKHREWMGKQAKRASAAIGGGAMIGAGLVFHPMGGALLAGGVSVLGTEFETPNRMVRNVRDTFEQWATSSTCGNSTSSSAAATTENGNGKNNESGSTTHSDGSVGGSTHAGRTLLIEAAGNEQGKPRGRALSKAAREVEASLELARRIAFSGGNDTHSISGSSISTHNSIRTGDSRHGNSYIFLGGAAGSVKNSPSPSTGNPPQTPALSNAAKQVEKSLELARLIAFSGETKSNDYRRGKVRSIDYDSDPMSPTLLPNPTPPRKDKKDKDNTSNDNDASDDTANTISDRMKGFGRRFVLPLLDKMAGDRRATTKKTTDPLSKTNEPSSSSSTVKTFLSASSATTNTNTAIQKYPHNVQYNLKQHLSEYDQERDAPLSLSTSFDDGQRSRSSWQSHRVGWNSTGVSVWRG